MTSLYQHLDDSFSKPSAFRATDPKEERTEGAEKTFKVKVLGEGESLNATQSNDEN